MKKILFVVLCLLCFCISSYAENLYSLSLARENIKESIGNNTVKFELNGLTFNSYTFKEKYSKIGMYSDISILLIDECSFEYYGQKITLDSSDFEKYFHSRTGIGLAFRHQLSSSSSLIGGVGGVFSASARELSNISSALFDLGGSAHVALLLYFNTDFYLRIGAVGGVDIWRYGMVSDGTNSISETVDDFSQTYIRPHIGLGIVGR